MQCDLHDVLLYAENMS